MTNRSINEAVELARALQAVVDGEVGPPEVGVAARGRVVPQSIVRSTRGYIEKTANQVNGSYEQGWYDACAVMIRRLLETLIIEAFEAKGIASTIKTSSGDFLFLGDLVDRCLAEKSWNLTRNCKRALPRLKDIGDKSAHSRRYNAVRDDIEPLVSDVRLIVEELVHLAHLK